MRKVSCLIYALLLCLSLVQSALASVSDAELSKKLNNLSRLVLEHESRALPALQSEYDAFANSSNLVLLNQFNILHIDVIDATGKTSLLEKTILDFIDNSKTLGNTAGIVIGQSYMTRIHLKRLDIESAELALNNVYNDLPIVKDEVALMAIHQNIARFFRTTHDLHTAIERMKFVLNISEKTSYAINYQRIRALNLIGGFSLANNQLEQAKNYFTQALNLAQQAGSKDYQSKLLSNLGALAKAKKDNIREEARTLQALEIAEQYQIPHQIMITLINLSDFNQRMGNYPLCIKQGERAIEVSKQHQNLKYSAYAYFNLGTCQFLSKDISAGEATISHISAELQTQNDLNTLVRLLGGVVKALEKSGQFDLAYRYLQKRVKHSKALNVALRERSVETMRERYGIDASEQTIDELSADNQIKSELLTQQKLYTRFNFILFVLVLVSVIFTVYSYIKMRKKNKLLKAANQQLAYTSERDPLTNLLNRRAFHRFIKTQALNSQHAFLLLDIDHFKQLNDHYGHQCGDEVLIALSQRLQQQVRNSDKLVRWGGEEFLIFTNNICKENLVVFCQRLIDSISCEPFTFDGQSHNVTISIGFFHARGVTIGESSWEEQVQVADNLLYQSKRNGRERATGYIDKNQFTCKEINEHFDEFSKDGHLELLEVTCQCN